LKALTLTEVQIRLLADFADENISTRHTRTTSLEWRENRQALLNAGLLRVSGAPPFYQLTAAGRAVLTGEDVEA
jgi:hypothetical protein